MRGREFIKAGSLNNLTARSPKPPTWMECKVIGQRVVGNEFGDEYTKEIINVFDTIKPHCRK